MSATSSLARAFSAFGIAVAITAGTAIAAGTAAAATKPAANKTGEFLFVQTSQGMTYDAKSKTLALTGVSPVTLFASSCASPGRVR